MHEIKTGPAKASFWCGILTAEAQAAAPKGTRTVRGPYTTFNLANAQRDRPVEPEAEPAPDAEGREKT